jgi:GMP synthase (glutamine-hydrolysing)
VLAWSDRYPQAFRHGSALGIQAHPEASPEMAAAWLTALGADRVAATGTDPEGIVEEMAAHRAESRALARDLFGAWLSRL